MYLSDIIIYFNCLYLLYKDPNYILLLGIICNIIIACFSNYVTDILIVIVINLATIDIVYSDKLSLIIGLSISPILVFLYILIYKLKTTDFLNIFTLFMDTVLLVVMLITNKSHTKDNLKYIIMNMLFYVVLMYNTIVLYAFETETFNPHYHYINFNILSSIMISILLVVYNLIIEKGCNLDNKTLLAFFSIIIFLINTIYNFIIDEGILINKLINEISILYSILCFLYVSLYAKFRENEENDAERVNLVVNATFSTRYDNNNELEENINVL